MNYLLIPFFIFFFHFSHSETFKVALTIIPNLNPITNQINNGNYISLHLYFPLFYFSPNSDTPESSFLDMSKTKSSSINFKNYIFCLKENIKFSDGSVITSSHLNSSLILFSTMYPHMLPLQSTSIISNNCLSLTLKSPLPGLFRKLTGVSSTILKDPTSKDSFPIGLGAYRVVEKNSNDLLISYIGSNKPRFDKIKFFTLTNEVKNMKFHDQNQLPPRNAIVKPPNAREIKAPSYKVYANILNISDKKKRAIFFNILKKVNWIKIYNLKLQEKERFLPLNDFSIAKREPLQNTENCSRIKPVPLLIVNLYEAKAIQEELKSINISNCFKVYSFSPEQFASWVFSGKEYIGMIAFDSSGSIASLEGDFSVYFESFFSKKNRIISTPLKKIQEYIESSQKTSITQAEKLNFFIKAEKFIINEHFLQPIGQTYKNFFFPNDIEIVDWFDFYSGIPKVNLIR